MDVTRSVYQQGRLVNKVRNIIKRCEEATPMRKRKRSKDLDGTTINERDEVPPKKAIIGMI